MRVLVACALVCLPAAGVLAQQSGTSLEPIVRTSIDPPVTIVGQKTILTVDLLAPNFMTKPPDLPDFQIRNAITRKSSTTNMSERISGTTYAGMRILFWIFPQEPGTYSIAGQRAKVTYAAVPPASLETAVRIPDLSFEAKIPDPALALEPYVAAKHLTLQQVTRLSSTPLKVGDTITRSVTIRAEATPAMLLPPLTFEAVPGTAIYKGQPALSDALDGRAGEITAMRTDEATYVIQKAGAIDIPAISFGWWNVETGRVDQVRADAISLQVLDEGRAGKEDLQADERGILDFAYDHWFAILLVVATIGLAAAYGPALWARAVELIRSRRRAYLDSEAGAFARLRRSLRSGQAEQVYGSLLLWVGPGSTIRELRAASQDPDLDRELDGLEHNLFGPAPLGRESWSRRSLKRRLRVARKRLLRSATQRRRSNALPALNPTVSDAGGGL